METKRPKISIITISFNSDKTLEDTINSVISQDYPNLEYLIVDGGSKDRTLDIVDKYRDKIDVVVSEPDKGISDAFNKGIQLATGEIIGIINSDDLLMPGALQEISDHYSPNIDVYSGNVLFWDDKTGETFSTKPEMTFDKLKVQYGVAHPSRFIRKDAYDRYGSYVEHLRYCMDAELLCRFYKKGAVFSHIDRDLTKFRLGGTTAQSIYKKKEDVRYFVDSFGGSKWDFKLLWLKKVVKYHILQVGYFIFGENMKFKLNRFAGRIKTRES